MTSQNIIFLVVLGVVGMGILLRFSAILQHMPLFLGGVAVVLGVLVALTRQGMIDWDEWIPKGRE